MKRHSDTSTPKSEEPEAEEVHKSVCPEGWKVAKRMANNTIIELVPNHFKRVSTTATKKVQVFKDLVIVVDKKAVAAQDAVCLRDEHHKYKAMKAG